MYERGKLNKSGEPMNELKDSNAESMKDMNNVESMSSDDEDMMWNDEREKQSNDEWLTENESVSAELLKVKKASSEKFWKMMKKWKEIAKTANKQGLTC